MGVGAVGYPKDYYNVPDNSKSNGADGEKTDFVSIKEIIEKYVEDNKITAQELKEDKDWREMSDDEWKKLIANVDEYIDDYKERLEQLKKLQEEAVKKAAAEADADKKAILTAEAALSAAASGFVTDSVTEDNSEKEKNWTKTLKTDDQTILRTAKIAQEAEDMAMSKLQEMQLTGNTSAGISKTGNVTECATTEEDENKDTIWTITAFGEDGIISKRFKNGEEIDRWEIKYKNPDDARKVWDYLNKFDKEEDLKFAGDKAFWEEFLAGKRS